MANDQLILSESSACSVTTVAVMVTVDAIEDAFSNELITTLVASIIPASYKFTILLLTAS